MCLTLLYTIPNPLTDRSANLFSSDNFSGVAEYFSAIDPFQDAESFSAVLNAEGGDMSWLMRISKWLSAIKLWLLSPFNWLLGVGPGTFGPSLDGGWIRLLTETGLVGLVLFATMFRRIAGMSPALLGIVCAVFINMVTIDIHLAYKAMAMVFFCAGYQVARAGRAKRPNVIAS
jgi:hypothetical protein